MGGRRTYQSGQGASNAGGNEEDLAGLVGPEEIGAGAGGEKGEEVGDGDLFGRGRWVG